MNASDRPDSPCQHATALPIEDHVDRLFAYAYRLAGSVEAAEDLTQQTFLIAHQRQGQLREPEKLGSWLLKILRNAFLKSRRRPTPLVASQVEFDVAEIASGEARDVEIDEEQLQAALARLPEEFRVVVLMFYFEELSYREIAEELTLPVGTVMSRLSRAKGHLRHILLTPEKLTS
jgi:RNA polymerase sigma-70 factor (ECF subfamily)